MKKKILFVDDESHVLDGLRRMLRSVRHEWHMEFAHAGHEALDILSKEPFDVIVSDMRMPGMDGVSLLTEVMERYPNMVRIVLSGQSDQELILNSVRPVHQYLSKPCDPEKLKATIAQASRLQELLADDILKRVVSQMESLPSLPSLYADLMKELESPDSSISKVGEIISKDVGMTAKILQLVNSAFFGLCRHISSPAQAASLLGVEMIKALVLTVQIFSQFKQATLPSSFQMSLWSHSMATGAFAKTIAKLESQEQAETDNAFMAGVLHDAGKLVLASNFPEEYLKALKMTKEHGVALQTAEFELFDTTHAEVGAYLMGLWGLPHAIVEALAFHHRPGHGLAAQFTPLTAVHAANGLAHEPWTADQSEVNVEIDEHYLQELDVLARLPLWQDACQQVIRESKAQGG